jgi:hypothetical protein
VPSLTLLGWMGDDAVLWEIDMLNALWALAHSRSKVPLRLAQGG